MDKNMNDKINIKSNVLSSEIQEFNLEHIINEPEKNQKLRGNPKDIKQDKQNYIENINTKITQTNKEQNKVIIETNDIRPNNDDDHLSKPYASLQSNIGNNNLQPRNDKHLDIGYISTQSKIFLNIFSITFIFNNEKRQKN